MDNVSFSSAAPYFNHNSYNTSYGGSHNDAVSGKNMEGRRIQEGGKEDLSVFPQEEGSKSGACETCKNRKYQDGSDEMVSFKSAAHIAPEAAASVVRSHEQEHVSNAYTKAATENGKVLRASVTLHTAVCPECGRSYISGGTTQTQIKYFNEENPYQQELREADRAKYTGMNVDAVL